MKFDMLYLPVPDLAKALAFYRDGLGWAEAWREGETTAGLQLPAIRFFFFSSTRSVNVLLSSTNPRADVRSRRSGNSDRKP